jgi:intracellular multiplication protein IcmC
MPVPSLPAPHIEYSRCIKGDNALFIRNIFKFLSAHALAALSVCFLIGTVHPASAQTLGDVFCNVFNNSKPFAQFCQWTAYLAGAVFTLQGIHHFRLHGENPQNNPLNRAIMLWFGAMCLLALPSAIGTIILSIYASPSGGGALSCGSAGGGGTATTPDIMLTNLVDNIKAPLTSLVSLIAIVCGLFMIVRGFMKAAKYGFDPRTHSVNSILANIVFGALLMTIGDNLNMMLASVFGSGTVSSGTAVTASSVLSWGFVSSVGGGSQQFATAIAAALTFIQLIGAIAFVRGWLIMKKVVEGGGQATMAQGITHILGGVFAINIGAVLKIFDNTLGTGMM